MSTLPNLTGTDVGLSFTTRSSGVCRAALLCAVTAVCVWKGKYVAVGEPAGGYLFLPPWDL